MSMAMSERAELDVLSSRVEAAEARERLYRRALSLLLQSRNPAHARLRADLAEVGGVPDEEGEPDGAP